jgi:hypothetical protein
MRLGGVCDTLFFVKNPNLCPDGGLHDPYVALRAIWGNLSITHLSTDRQRFLAGAVRSAVTLPRLAGQTKEKPKMKHDSVDPLPLEPVQ